MSIERSRVGSAWLLGRMRPATAFLAGVAISNGAVGALRLCFEGRWYDRALSSAVGDPALSCYFAAASVAVRRAGASGGLRNRRWHCVTVAGAVLLGVAAQIRAVRVGGRPQTPADTYHNLVVVPVYTYAIVSTAPAVAGAPRSVRAVAAAAVAAWSVLFLIDATAGTLDRNTAPGPAHPGRAWA